MKNDPQKQHIENALLVRQYMEEHNVSTAKACEALSVSVNNYYRFARAAGITLGPAIGGHPKKKVKAERTPKAAPKAPPTQTAPVAAAVRPGQKPGQVVLVVGSPGDVAAVLGRIM